MRYVQVLSRRPLAVLWLSQLLSATGDQIYLVAALWIAAQISPACTALVAASEFGSAFVCSLFAGVYADRVNRIKAMIVADLVRALVVLTLPVAAYYGSITIPHLILVGITLGSLGTLFDPCLSAVIPAVALDAEALHSTNALMDATKRLARTVGPGLAGLLAACIPISQFFTIDALSFLASAIGIAYLGYKYKSQFAETAQDAPQHEGIVAELKEALASAKTNRVLARDFATFAIANFAYAIAYTVGLPTVSQQRYGGAIGAYGYLIGAYGAGSLVGNLFLGNLAAGRSSLIIFIGYLIWGAGFLIIGLAPSLPIALLGSALGAIGSPLVNVTVQTTIQGQIPARQIGKVFALRATIAYVGVGIGLAFAPLLFKYFPAKDLIAYASLLFFAVAFLCRTDSRTRKPVQEPSKATNLHSR